MDLTKYRLFYLNKIDKLDNIQFNNQYENKNSLIENNHLKKIEELNDYLDFISEIKEHLYLKINNLNGNKKEIHEKMDKAYSICHELYSDSFLFFHNLYLKDGINQNNIKIVKNSFNLFKQSHLKNATKEDTSAFYKNFTDVFVKNIINLNYFKRIENNINNIVLIDDFLNDKNKKENFDLLTNFLYDELENVYFSYENVNKARFLKLLITSRMILNNNILEFVLTKTNGVYLYDKNNTFLLKEYQFKLKKDSSCIFI